ncbi:uncharacterized protein MYCGRDRAFT_108931 [Zymoseptoria tritici IPO323]|uniref:Uncharacterized protein n=1 Tax=Zymoseptoria tritici (strain CBS 115943 / IPO323) TaxID=336722 RepID=F9X835_ZYMTI|nr:uncharacterized protein MYCGRDRAFT_108931 [Zymoseptoria tritici IPO323]EGP87789.1 hypothetical protein MYCGRDRAFT_108931 [Zymoseptoria tritici IPO323]
MFSQGSAVQTEYSSDRDAKLPHRPNRPYSSLDPRDDVSAPLTLPANEKRRRQVSCCQPPIVFQRSPRPATEDQPLAPRGSIYRPTAERSWRSTLQIRSLGGCGHHPDAGKKNGSILSSANAVRVEHAATSNSLHSH